eukprot:3418432-Amphidinium_carterae.1
MSGPQGSEARGFDSELEEHFEELEKTVASYAASYRSADRNSAGGRKNRAEAYTPCWIGRYPVQLAQC